MCESESVRQSEEESMLKKAIRRLRPTSVSLVQINCARTLDAGNRGSDRHLFDRSQGRLFHATERAPQVI